MREGIGMDGSGNWVAATAGIGSAKERVTFRPAADSVRMNDRAVTFHELHERYAPEVYRFALWLGGDPTTARDITAETFARAWTAPTEPREETVKAYLFAIARNLHRKQWRHAARHTELEETMPDPAPQPDESAGQRDDLRQAWAAVQALPEMDRRVLLLRAEEGMPYEDIAALTGLSVATAKVKVFRARARLAAQLQADINTQL